MSPVVLVTGASRGIGFATANLLLEIFSARVVTISRTLSPELKSLVEKYPNSLTTIQGDIASPNVHFQAVSAALESYGGLDALVLNAGTTEPFGRIASPDLAVDSWKSHFDVNFFSLLHTLQAALPHLRERKGRVIFISSGAAVGKTAAWGPYNASKAAMNSLARTLANEEEDIVCVALRPGVVDTDMQTSLRAKGGETMSPKEFERFITLHKNSALVKPEDCGHVIASLAVSAPKELSGQFVSWDADECKDFRRK
ncbi:hypothetical protein BOTBODRAFT_34192 [Botryobasidium botryosum FD-172 SS1]|uniref:Uncharacterized protein n=1 Tax=Botryobasidium botryosum (strain FD-172 SS1) TaxID=930990 RepID=A0A067MLH3_BOTB1|nr:hypothetical protein BOTBODRAFT_34192 [Botryobasidium botryosum FD-172 SS1]